MASAKPERKSRSLRDVNSRRSLTTAQGTANVPFRSLLLESIHGVLYTDTRVGLSQGRRRKANETDSPMSDGGGIADAIQYGSAADDNDVASSIEAIVMNGLKQAFDRGIGCLDLFAANDGFDRPR